MEKFESRTDFSPGPEATDGEASNPGPRLRKRGPRSEEALERHRRARSSIVASGRTSDLDRFIHSLDEMPSKVTSPDDAEDLRFTKSDTPNEAAELVPVPPKKRQKIEKRKVPKVVPCIETEGEADDSSETQRPQKKRRGKKPSDNKQSENIKFLLVNIRSLRNKINSAKLYLQLEQSKPDVILITETWLDSSTEEVAIPGYRSIARRDRAGDKIGGGVDIFVRNNFWNVGLLAISETSERS
jgi:hypothetical protein